MRLGALLCPLSAIILLGARLTRADDLQSLYERRLPFMAYGDRTTAGQVKGFVRKLQLDGTWADLDYTSGCSARRANWPASRHWLRIMSLAVAYRGGVDGLGRDLTKSKLRGAIGRAMEFWFANDFSAIGSGACLDDGGVAGDLCPCETPGLWNTNCNVILIPRNVGQVCLLLREELTPTELGNCTLITSRAYNVLYREPLPGYANGANLLNMASIGVSAGLLENNRTGNVTRIMDAYRRVHDEIITHPEDRVGGIKPDGSFHQHNGIIYDGNYGKDFSNSVIELELQAVGTQFQANQTTRNTFGWYIGGAQWMAFANTLTKTVNWDMTVMGRMIAWPVADRQASADLRMNLTHVSSLGRSWNQSELVKFGTELANPSLKTASVGELNGNRMFWNSDYMVHRTKSTLTTVKMLSKRTSTSECLNEQNTKGFHLSDGATYTYTTGAEYEDMYATFDFSLVPGTTTDYGNTPLNCNNTRQFGVDAYAGGVSAGDVGVAAMRYANPLTGALSFNKAYFFFPNNVQHVLVNSIRSTSSAPVFSVLDQRLRNGNVYIDGESINSGNYSDVKRLWHAGTGYAFPSNQGTRVSVDAEIKAGDWATIGTSKQRSSTKDMFSAWIVHNSNNLAAPIEYSVFPANKNRRDFENTADRLQPYTIANTDIVSAAVSSNCRTLGAAFWKADGGSVSVPDMGLVVYVNKPLVLMLKLAHDSSNGELSVSDPTHEATEANVRVVWTSRELLQGEGYLLSRSCRTGFNGQSEVALTIKLPAGGMAGSTVTQKFER